MNIWNKIVLGTKFVFGGFESATDYLIELLNSFIGKENVAGKVQKALEFVTQILSYMKKYEKYCPAIWTSDYKKIIEVVEMFVNTLDDNKVTSEELKNVVESVQAAIADWMK